MLHRPFRVCLLAALPLLTTPFLVGCDDWSTMTGQPAGPEIDPEWLMHSLAPLENSNMKALEILAIYREERKATFFVKVQERSFSGPEIKIRKGECYLSTTEKWFCEIPHTLGNVWAGFLKQPPDEEEAPPDAENATP